MTDEKTPDGRQPPSGPDAERAAAEAGEQDRTAPEQGAGEGAASDDRPVHVGTDAFGADLGARPQGSDAPSQAPAEPPEAQTDASADDVQPTVVVRYGAMGHLGRFARPPAGWRQGQRVIVKSDRGLEIGTIVAEWDEARSRLSVSPRTKGAVIHPVTHADEVEQRHLREGEQRECAYCAEQIAHHNLPMKLVAAEHLFGGDRIVFYFVAESRVDFRALVRDLAHEFQTRIEMRQIGVRDEARIVGDYERCGRPLCCRAWIKDLAPVSMRMAKLQKATLDPAKISGHCGRLMCCLRFEHATYRELAANLPPKDTYVATTEGIGKVVDTHVVTQMVAVELAAGRRVNVPVESLLQRDVDPEAVRRGAAAPAEPEAPPRPRPQVEQPAPPPREGAETAEPAHKRRRGRRGRRRPKRGPGGQSQGAEGRADAAPESGSNDRSKRPSGREDSPRTGQGDG